MTKFEHAYLEIEGNKYYDYEAVWDVSSWGFKPSKVLISQDVAYKLNSLDGIADKTVFPKKGSSVYVFPNCSIPLDEIRRNYTIKRCADTADYNIVSPSKIEYHWGKYQKFTDILVFPKNKFVYLSCSGLNCSTAVLFSNAEACTTQILKTEEMVRYKDVALFRLEGALADHAMTILTSKYSKPVVPVTNLDINTGNELNLDVLMVAKPVCTKGCYERNAEENALLQLNIINNYNWRDYPGTMSVFLNQICRGSCTSMMKRHPSKFNKSIREMLALNCTDFADEKDFLLAQSMINSILNIGEQKFVSMDQLDNKLRENRIQRNTFIKLYTDILRIVPKQFKEKKDEEEEN